MICYVMVWIFFKLTGVNGGDGLVFSWHFLFMVVPLFIMLIFSTGVGMILSVLCVYFRDIEYIWDVLMRLLMYLLPILYSIQRFGPKSRLRLVIKINPIYSMIELFRQCVLTGEWMHPKMLLYASVSAIIMLAIGLLIFNWKSDEIIYHL